MSAVTVKNIPETWISSTLGSVCEKPQYGWTTKATDSGNLKLLRTTDITKGEINWFTVPFCSSEPKDKEKYLLHDGDIVVSRAGSVGVSYLITNPDPSVFASYLIRFKPLINRKYVYYFLQSPAYWSSISEKSAGIAVQNVNASKLKDITIPIAPPKQQKRIVAKIEELFSHIDAGIAALNQSKKLLKQYRQSVLKAAVTGELTKQWREENKDTLEPASELLARIVLERREKWEAQQLAQFEAKGKMPKNDKWKERYKEPHIAAIRDNLPKDWVAVTASQLTEHIVDGTHHTPQYTDEGIDFISAKNVKDWEIDYSNTKKISLEEHKKLINRCHPKKGDVLITKSGTLGRVAVVKDDHIFSVFESVAVFPVVDKFLSNYIALAVHEAAMGDAGQKIQKGIGVKHLHLEDLRKMEFLLPPKEELKEIFSSFDTLSSSSMKTEKLVDLQLLKAEKTKKSILASAFFGQLVETLDSDGTATELLRKIKEQQVLIKANEKLEKKRKPIRKKATKLEKQTIIDILKQSSEPISPEKIFELTGRSSGEIDEIEDFYIELKRSLSDPNVVVECVINKGIKQGDLLTYKVGNEAK